jgi:hypothetical protein
MNTLHNHAQSQPNPDQKQKRRTKNRKRKQPGISGLIGPQFPNRFHCARIDRSGHRKQRQQTDLLTLCGSGFGFGKLVVNERKRVE